MISARTEERIGQILMIGFFGFSLMLSSRGLMAMLAAPQKPAYWQLSFASQFIGLLFVAMVVLMTVRRLPARNTATGIAPRLTALGGTFLLILLVLLPPGGAGLAVTLSATTLMVIGTLGSVYCLHFLGRSFSIMASARELVTRGPYGIVRHPLYLAEGITTIGIILAHWSPAAIGLGMVQMALQFRRMQNEEAILREAFPADYEAYAQRTPMIIPGLATAG